MALQGVLPYEYESEKHETGLTAMAGLPTYLDLAFVAGLRESVKRHVKVRAEGQGWTDWQMVISAVLLNLAGGESVEDLRLLEGDEGVRCLVRQVETYKLPWKERRALERRWRKERKRSVPSPSAMFRYLEAFHDAEQEKKRVAGKAFIPQPNSNLQGLRYVNRDLVSFVQSRSPQRVATIDLDATLVETQKQDALYCYKHFKAYQPLNLYWAEQDLLVHSEFREGNVPAGYDLLRVFEEGLRYLPAGVEEVRLRGDTAAYNHELLRYCDEGRNERFGRIGFSIGCEVTAEFKRAVLEVPESELEAAVSGERGSEDQDEPGVGRGLLCAECPRAQQGRRGISVSGNPGSHESTDLAWSGGATGTALPNSDPEAADLQALRSGHQPGLGGGADHQLDV